MPDVATNKNTRDKTIVATADDQTWIIDRNVILTSEVNSTFYSDYGNDKVVNYGSLDAGFIGIYFGNTDASDGSITNAISGDITGQFGIATAGQHQTINNAGTINAISAAIAMDGIRDTARNTGYIYAVGDGVEMSNSGQVLTNSGTISGGHVGVEIDASATSANTITNAGVLQGNRYVIQDSSNGPLHLTNSGALDGNVLLGSGSDTVRNTGRILGSINLGNGTDSFDGRGGTVKGLIAGGTGADTVRMGGDGETVSGGAGRDVLYAGTGADTFVYASTAAADADVLYGFNTAQDSFQLDHAAFTALAAGQTPVFANAAKATSATDHLFYNSANGALSYDQDGSGAAHAAVLIAKLDTGLTLSARNFSVV